MQQHPRIVYWPRNLRGRDEGFSLLDTISGIPYCRALLEALVRAAFPRCVNNAPTALLLIDVHGLGRVNRESGEATGDGVVETVTARLSGPVLSAGGCLGHCGGRSLVLLPDAAESEAMSLADALLRRAEAAEPEHGVCIGIALSRGCRAAKLVREAARALHNAKAEGGRRVGVSRTAAGPTPMSPLPRWSGLRA